MGDEEMEQLGKLLRQMRGETSVEELAHRAPVSVEFWLDLERGRAILSGLEARRLLRRAFNLTPPDAQRLILGLQLYDLGLYENYLRQLVIDLIQGVTPSPVRKEVRRLYRSYTP